MAPRRRSGVCRRVDTKDQARARTGFVAEQRQPPCGMDAAPEKSLQEAVPCRPRGLGRRLLNAARLDVRHRAFAAQDRGVCPDHGRCAAFRAEHRVGSHRQLCYLPSRNHGSRDVAGLGLAHRDMRERGPRSSIPPRSRALPSRSPGRLRARGRIAPISRQRPSTDPAVARAPATSPMAACASAIWTKICCGFGLPIPCRASSCRRASVWRA